MRHYEYTEIYNHNPRVGSSNLSSATIFLLYYHSLSSFLAGFDPRFA